MAGNLNGNTNAIQGPLTVVGDGNDTLNVDDTGNTTGQSWPAYFRQC